MRKGQKVIYTGITGTLSGTIHRKLDNEKAIVKFSDSIYGSFKKTIPMAKLYIKTN